ncbi:MAG: glycosyltransferase family 4 protein [Planctomycetes bacterium]|nr:glycosyltransferase family 4 protein [Planctomycetota bacterium]
MGKRAKKKVVFISSFLPRKCGIATFTSDLITSTAAAAKGEFEPLVVAMRSDNDLKYDDPVKFEIRQNVKSDYICAADYINFSHVDLVSVQHEFGLFGGEAGAYLSLLLNRLKAPIITTLHTVLDDPDQAYHKALVEVCSASYKVITMNERGVTMLREIYAVSGKKVELIAHGIPDLPFVDSNYYKHKFGMEGRRTILTFGLLNRNKGVEVMLRAMPAIIKAEPSVLYIVLGMTHPNVLKHDGESYRFSLQRLVKDLGLQDHVIFHNRFVSDQELHNFLCAADIYVTPYLSRKQLTSGTLSFAVGTGKTVVSTPYWAAMELLADGRGKLVQSGDSKEIGDAIVELLENDSLFYSLRRRAYEYGRSRTWPKIGQIYWKLFSAKRLPVRVAAKTPLSAAETISNIEVPEPSLKHLKRLTDDTGLCQHAKFTIPNREHGYCTDDNARAVIAMAEYYAQHPGAEALGLFETYLSFIMHSQNKDGSIKNFMNFDRTWAENEPTNDAFGRVLWAFGMVMAKPPSPAYLSILKDCFDRSVGRVQRQYPRGMAYSILGMSDYLKQFPGASDIKRLLEIAADGLVAQYEENSLPDWQWFEDALTYDNAVLSHALFVAGSTLGNEKYVAVAKNTCEFLLANTFNGEHFSFVGCKGWYERRRTKAAFDQLPIEAASTVMMLRAAYDATGDNKYLRLQRKAFDWFLGANDLHVELYDFRTKGCNDGLMRGGVNINQGAESTLSFLLSLLAMVETYAIIDKIQEGKSGSAAGQIDIIGQIAESPAAIKDISGKSKSKSEKREVDELA